MVTIVNRGGQTECSVGFEQRSEGLFRQSTGQCTMGKAAIVGSESLNIISFFSVIEQFLRIVAFFKRYVLGAQPSLV